MTNTKKETRKLLAEVKNLKLSFRSETDPSNPKLVIRNTSLDVYEGEVHALIGESGSGKSVISSTLFGLVGKTAVFEEGSVIVNGVEVQDFSQRQ